MLRTLVLAILLLLASPLPGAASLRVLVVGSDWSECHQWPLMSALMAAGSRPPVGVQLRSVSTAGAALHQLAGTASLTRQLQDGPWDLILLQVHPVAVAYERADCLRALRTIVAASEARRILIWHPPGPSVDPTRRAQAEADLDALAAELGSERWHLDAAWEAAQGLALPIEDPLGLPSPHGAYLLACALFAEATGRDPRQAITSIQHQALEPLWLPAESAERLQRAADLAVTQRMTPSRSRERVAAP